MRAALQSFDDEPRILADPIAPLFVDFAAPDPWLAALFVHPFARQWRAGFALRSRYAEDCLADCAARGVDQYAILGAGLDTFAYRQPEWGKRLSIFELDHPATQRDKQVRLARAGVAVPHNLAFVSADFWDCPIRC
jgi:methyltransferase (TIGR00027 family)